MHRLGERTRAVERADVPTTPKARELARPGSSDAGPTLADCRRSRNRAGARWLSQRRRATSQPQKQKEQRRVVSSLGTFSREPTGTQSRGNLELQHGLRCLRPRRDGYLLDVETRL